MDFEFTAEERDFIRQVKEFLRENHDPDVMDVTRENMAQVCDTPERRAFMKKLAERGWLGITWPKEYGGQDGEGFYEYLLNELLSSVGAPQIGKGVGIIGKTLIKVGSEKLKKEFLPKILDAEVEFAVGYSEPSAGSDAAAMRLKAERKDAGWVLNGQKIFTTSAHFADWYWVGARTDPDAPKHHGISLFLVPHEPSGPHDPPDVHDGRRAHQRGVLRQRLRPRRLSRRRTEQGLPVHCRGARHRTLHDVHVLADPRAHGVAVRLRQDRKRVTASR
jgi:alkylation response protein AidB-like acyl-CoA dehydrogenase